MRSIRTSPSLNNTLCPITGGKVCHCPGKTPTTIMGAALLIDMKSALRKVFTDHAVYTSTLISESLPILQPPAEAVTERLLKNPQDIADLIEPIVGSSKANAVKEQFSQHLLLAAGAVTEVREGNEETVANAVNNFYEQGDKLARALYELNTNKLNSNTVKKLIREHNEHVVQLATLRKSQEDHEYYAHYDIYYAHMLGISDALHGALLP